MKITRLIIIVPVQIVVIFIGFIAACCALDTVEDWAFRELNKLEEVLER